MAMSSVAPAEPTIGKGASRTGTGRFDAIAEEIFIPLIMARVPCEVRCTCAIAVCRAWRHLRDVKELWTEISIGSGGLAPERWGSEGTPGLEFPFLHPGISPRGVLRFVSWLRNPAGVVTLSLDTGDSIAPDAVKTTLEALPALTSLSLNGKITGAVLKDMSKLPAACNLTTLSIDTLGEVLRATEGTAACSNLCQLLEVATSLTTLALAAHLAPKHVLRRISDAHMRARKGAPPLLTRLSITKSYDVHLSSCKWETFQCLGALFPELEALDIANCSDGDDSQFGSARSIYVGIICGDPASCAALPNLRHLTIREMCGFSSHMSDASCDCAIGTTLQACPVLESLHVTHGKMGYPFSTRPFPSIQICFHDAPPSLTDIALKQITLHSEAFDMFDGLELRRLAFVECGPHASVIAAKLGAACAGLIPEVS